MVCECCSKNSGQNAERTSMWSDETERGPCVPTQAVSSPHEPYVIQFGNKLVDEGDVVDSLFCI